MGWYLVGWPPFCYIFIYADSKQADRKDQKDKVQKTPAEETPLEVFKIRQTQIPQIIKKYVDSRSDLLRIGFRSRPRFL